MVLLFVMYCFIMRILSALFSIDSTRFSTGPTMQRRGPSAGCLARLQPHGLDLEGAEVRSDLFAVLRDGDFLPPCFEHVGDAPRSPAGPWSVGTWWTYASIRRVGPRYRPIASSAGFTVSMMMFGASRRTPTLRSASPGTVEPAR